MQHIFLYISLPLFCTTSTKEKSYMILHSIFFISLLLAANIWGILTLLAANICHFLIAALNFSFAMNFVYFLFLFLSCFVFRSSSFSVIGVSVVVVGGKGQTHDHVITTFSRMYRLPFFLSHVRELR